MMGSAPLMGMPPLEPAHAQVDGTVTGLVLAPHGWMEYTLEIQQDGFTWALCTLPDCPPGTIDGELYPIWDEDMVTERSITNEPEFAESGILEREEFKIEKNTDGTFTYTTHHPYVADSMGNWVPYIEFEDQEHVQVMIGGGKIVVDKNECAATYFDVKGNIILKSEAYTARTAIVGTDDWSALPVNNQGCIVSTAQGEDLEDTLVTLTKVDNEGQFDLEYKINPEKIKATAKYTNLFYTNNKFAFTQSVQLVDPIVKLNSGEYDISQMVGMNFDHATLVDNMDIALEAKQLFFGAGLGFDQLWNVNISENNQINLDYAAQDDIAIAIGETIELDPFWTMKSGDNYGNNTHAREWSVGLTTSAYPNTGSPPDRLGCGGRLSLHTNGGNLGDEGVGDGTTVGYPRNYIGSWYSWNGCRVATANWDITAIPTTAIIKDVNMHLEVETSSAASTDTCEFNQITQRGQDHFPPIPTGSAWAVGNNPYEPWNNSPAQGQPGSTAYGTQWDAFTDATNGGQWLSGQTGQPNGIGHEYIDAWEGCLYPSGGSGVENRQYEISLGSSAVVDLQNNLNANTSIDGVAGWFSVAFPYTQHELPFASQQTATTKSTIFTKVKLAVTYEVPAVDPYGLLVSQNTAGEVELAWDGSEPSSNYIVSSAAVDTAGSSFWFSGGGTFATRHPHMVVGAIGNAWEFNPSNGGDHVKGVQMDLGDDFSINVWVKPRLYNYGEIIGKSNAANILTYADGHVYFSGGTTAAGFLEDNEWAMITVTQEGSASGNPIQIFKNGVKDSCDGGSTTNTCNGTGISSGLQEYYIGARNNSGNANYEFDGIIDELAVWNRVLSAQDIESLYGEGMCVACGTDGDGSAALPDGSGTGGASDQNPVEVATSLTHYFNFEKMDRSEEVFGVNTYNMNVQKQIWRFDTKATYSAATLTSTHPPVAFEGWEATLKAANVQSTDCSTTNDGMWDNQYLRSGGSQFAGYCTGILMGFDISSIPIGANVESIYFFYSTDGNSGSYFDYELMGLDSAQIHEWYDDPNDFPAFNDGTTRVQTIHTQMFDTPANGGGLYMGTATANPPSYGNMQQLNQAAIDLFKDHRDTGGTTFWMGIVPDSRPANTTNNNYAIFGGQHGQLHVVYDGNLQNLAVTQQPTTSDYIISSSAVSFVGENPYTGIAQGGQPQAGQKNAFNALRHEMEPQTMPIVGAPASGATTPIFVDGKMGTALYYNGVSDIANMDDPFGFKGGVNGNGVAINTDDMTFCGWGYPDIGSSASGGNLVSFGTAGAYWLMNNMYAPYYANNVLNWGDRFSEPNAVTPNAWNHMCVTLENDAISGGTYGNHELHIYINGQEIDMYTYPGQSAPNGSSGTLTQYTTKVTQIFNQNLIGAFWHPGQIKYLWKGMIDEFTLWNVVLDKGDIQKLYGNGFGAKPTIVQQYVNNIVNYFPFDETSAPYDNMVAVADPYLISYDIKRDGTVISSGTNSPSFTDTTVADGTEYDYEVIMTGGSGTDTVEVKTWGVPTFTPENLAGANGVPIVLTWDNITPTTVTDWTAGTLVGYSTSTNNITKTAGDGWANSKIQSDIRFTVGTPFEITFSPSTSSSTGYLGLGQGTLGYTSGGNGTPDNFEYAYFIAGESKIYENGVQVGSTQAAFDGADVYKIEVDGNGDVKYYRQAAGVGSFNLEHTSTKKATGSYYVQGEHYKSGEGFIDIAYIGEPNDANLSGYQLFRDSAASALVSLGDVGTHNDTTVVGGNTYDYEVAAYNPIGTGVKSTSISASAALAPDAPTSVDATAVPNQINLTWVTPGSDGGSAITGYKIFRTDNLTTPIQTVGVVNAWNGDASGTIGVSYTYNVHAVNAIGDSPAGVSDTVVHGNVPAQVIISSVAALLGLAIKIDWAEPADNAYAISSYNVEYTTNAGSSWQSVGTPNALTVTHQSLTEASTYQYRVSAVNALGTGAVSATTTPAVTAGDVPDAPSGHSATAVVGSEVDLAWAEPDDHAYAIDEYRIYRSLTTGGTYTLLVDSLTGLTHTDTSLTNGQAYFYKIQAHNSLGWSTDSTIVSATAADVPDQVTGLTSTAVAGSSVDLAWTAPSDNSNAITNYLVEHSDNNSTWTTKATVGNVVIYQAVYASGDNGSTKYWRITAINGLGSGTVSTSSNTVIGDVPAQVTGLTATAQSATEIDLTWNVPADNGYAITVYKVERSPDNSNWTTLTSTHATNSYDDTGLTASTDYYYKISASNALGIGLPSTVVTEKTFGVPSNITDLALTVASTTQINLSWTAPTLNGYAFTNFEVFQSEDGTNWTSISTITNVATTSLNVTGLNVNDLYYFKVLTTNAYGTSGDSNIENAPTLPTPPAAVNATATSDTAITVTWNQPTGDQQTSYKIERSLDDTNWTVIVASTGNTNTTYGDTGLTTLTTYYYKVSTINPSGTSVASPSGNAKTFGVPDAPTSLTATALVAIDIDLDWDAPTENNGAAVSGYKIERSTDGTNFAVIVADTGNTDTDYTDTDATLATDTTYYYRVSAINSFGAGDPSNIANALAGDVPAQVTGLVITSATTSTLDLVWVAPSDNGYTISGYKIEKSTDGTNFTTLVASNPDLDYTDTSLNTNDLYYYQISAINSFGTGTTSAIGSAPPLPTAPATLSLTVVTDVRIDLTWSNPTGAEESGFKIERSTDNTNWSIIVADTGSTALTYSNTGLTALTDYYYRVSTLNASGESSTSSVETAKTFGATEAPTSLTASSLTGAQIKLDWDAPTVTNGAAVSGYKIERSTDNTNYSVLVADTGNTDETYTDTGTAGTTYYYRVSAINTYGTSPPSNVDSALATDVPAQTTNFTATAQAGNEIDLAWTAPSNGGSAITGYQIERSLDNTNWSDLVADTGNQLIAYTDINLTTNQTYYYRVSAINLVGTGAPSVVNNDLAGDVPNQITVITATAQAGSEIVVAWTAPADNAYAITVYKIERSTDQTNWIVDGTSGTASFTSQSLTNGTTYYYRVQATNALGSSILSANVSDKAGDIPSQVTGFTGVALDDTRIKIDWTTPADNSYALSGYKIEQSLDNTNWSTVVANTNSSAVTYTVTGLTPITDYYHKVSAINGLGEGTSATSVLTTTMGVPDAITTLAGTAAVNSNNTQRSDITLTWTAPTANGTPITAYNVQVSIDGATWLNLPNVTTTSAIHSNTINDTDFSYRVYSVNAIGTSLVSNTGVVWSLPNVPTNLDVSPYWQQISVTWTVVDAVYTYDLEHSTDGNTWSTEADPATTQYDDTGLVNDTTHYYRIAATNPSGTSAFTTSVNATTFHLPTPPQNLTVTPTASNLLEANLDWDAPADDGGTPLLNYTVEKSVDQVNWAPLVSNCPPATDCTLSYYVDGALSTQNTYYWRVIAENAFGQDSANGYSSIVTYTTPTPAQSPSNLTVEPSGTNNNSATLDWVAPVDTGTHGISGYKIERQENNGAWSTLVTTTNTSTTFTDSTLAQSINYGYRVYTLTNNNTMVSSTTTNTASLEMLNITFTIGVTAIGGSTIAIQPDVLYSDGSHPPTVTQIRVFENSAYETDTTNTPQLLTLNITTGFDIMYAYTPVESTYFAIATLENGGTTQWTSNSVTVTPTAPFTGDLTIQEVREQDQPNVGANWSESELTLEIQPAGSDVIIKYQPEGSTIINTTDGSCTANCPSIVGYSSVTQAITHLQNWTWSGAPYTSPAVGLDANKDYYISVYIAPTFDHPTITVDGDPLTLTCTPAEYAMGCQPGNIPHGYPSDIAIKSIASPNAPPSLGIDQLGNLFGMPLVFVFVIGLAAVFTGRSAQMGVIIITACIGIMIYLGYITFDFNAGVNSTNATFALIVVVCIVGVFIGKRYS